MARLVLTGGDRGRRAQIALVFLALSTLLSPPGCRRATPLAGDVVVEWKITPAAPAVNGSVRAEILLFDRSHRPLTGASLQVEGHMSHPGMAPVIQPAREERPGVYSASLSFSMAGHWTVVVTGQLEDRRQVRQRVGDLTVRPAG
jgi:YtkA-like protein